MLKSEHETVMVEMCKKWPNKFSDTDLAYWCKNLNDYPLDAILNVLAAFKANNRFPPKLKEITSLLRPQRSAGPTRTFATVIAASMAQANPRLADCSEVELILRYHRYWFFRYRKMALGGSNGAAREIDRKRIDECRARSVEQCKRDLWLVLKDQAAVDSFADWIDAEQSAFELMLSQYAEAA